MSVRVIDFKGDGAAWIVIHRNGKRTTQKIGDWEEARELAQQIEQEHQRETAGSPSPLPLAVILEQHIESHVKYLKHSTYTLQTIQIRNHLIPEFGQVDARDLKWEHVKQFLDRMTSGLSVSYSMGCVNVLRKAITDLRATPPSVPDSKTWKLGLFRRRAETLGATEIRQIDSWSFAEAAKLLRIVHKHEPRYYPSVLTLLHTGCRRGEVLGMQWQDIDFDRMKIPIRRARVDSRTVTPKHRGPNDLAREVCITPAMESALRGLGTFRNRHNGKWVFASRNGTPIEETTLFRAWVRIRKKLTERGVRPLTMSSLRHTFATLSLASGKSVKWVSQQLGHKDASVTLNTYSHALPDEESDLSYLPIIGDVTTRHPDVTALSKYL